MIGHLPNCPPPPQRATGNASVVYSVVYPQHASLACEEILNKKFTKILFSILNYFLLIEGLFARHKGYVKSIVKTGWSWRKNENEKLNHMNSYMHRIYGHNFNLLVIQLNTSFKFASLYPKFYCIYHIVEGIKRVKRENLSYFI